MKFRDLRGTLPDCFVAWAFYFRAQKTINQTSVFLFLMNGPRGYVISLRLTMTTVTQPLRTLVELSNHPWSSPRS